MNLLSFAVTLCSVAILSVVSAHPVCTYDRLQLAIVTDEESCKQACADYTSNVHGACFAYRFSARYEDCDGYVLTEHDEYADTTECGVNPDASLEDPDEGNAQGSGNSLYNGCSLYSNEIGASADADSCRDKCVGLMSDRYGGCAAWFYDPSREQCYGLLAEFESYDNAVCGSVGDL